MTARRLVASALLITVSTAVVLTAAKGYVATQGAASSQQRFVAARTDLPVVYEQQCHVGIAAEKIEECAMPFINEGPLVVLIGDSHAAHWHPALALLAEQRGWRLVSITKSACPAVDTAVQLASYRRPYRECAEWRRHALNRIAELRPAIVVVAGSSRYDAGSPVAWEVGMQRTVSAVNGAGAVAVIIRDTPWPGFDVPRCLARAAHRNVPKDEASTFNVREAMAGGQTLADAEHRALRGQPRAHLVDLTRAICPVDQCSVESGGIVKYSDNNHLTATFSRHLASVLGNALDNLSTDHQRP